ncbi:MAG TPA: sigma-70 family RNA polymerase sigma factor [Kangiella sp.]|uniref:RNA polymerase sigma factor n=1 Tax=Kangiella sp. TaxID=1920245 RepID=UPI002F933799
MNDKALISRVLVDDDHHAFAALVRKHQQSILHFLRRLTGGNSALADDIAQQVFISAYDKLSTFRAEAGFNTWLHSIAYRSFLNEMRKSHHHTEVALTDDVLAPSIRDSVEQELLIEKLMARLSVTERTCMTLAYSAGMSHQEIVDVTQLPLGTVKSHINRGKHKLTKWVQQSQSRRKS